MTDCEALHSMIDVDTLGRAAVAAALSPALEPGVHYVNHPAPVSASELLGAVCAHVEQPAEGASVDVTTAYARAADSPRALHHLGMLTVDHWFRDDSFWSTLDCSRATPSPTPSPVRPRGTGRSSTLPDRLPAHRPALAPSTPGNKPIRRFIRWSRSANPYPERDEMLITPPGPHPLRPHPVVLAEIRQRA
ncbi:hypothetical protein ACR6C2_23680 [Streptomyces sp. INA 01156]